jgi:ankyrin repeat protein
MDSLLCGSTPNVSAFLEHSGCLRGSNVLGQTAAHVAVLRPDVLSLLLKAYSDFDVIDFDGFDSYGNSPLVYAAAYGYIESVVLLLKAGANPLKEGHLEFLQWALVWENWDMATASFAFFRTAGLFSDAFLQSELHYLMIEMIQRPWWWSQVYGTGLLEKMLNLGVDKHMLFEDGSTLLHCAPDSKWIDALFNAGFQRIDQSNIKGETALMTLVPCQSHMARNILARGCNVNHRDNRGETALQKAFTSGIFYWVPISHTKGTKSLESSSLKILSRDFAVIAELLHERADIWIYDNCRCPCAPHGCSPLRRLLRQNGLSMGYIWILEFLLMLDEIQGRAIAQREVLGLKRVREFNLADMTHVCGNIESTGAHEPMGDAEVDEIIDEEEEFVANLDKKMQETSSHENESIEESWLRLIADFWTPDSPVRRQKFWTSWDPATISADEEFEMTSSTLMRSYGTRGQDLSDFEEVTDKFWTLEQFTIGDYVPQSSVYSTWVEWVYQNPDKYDYPRPVDRNWYEKRKYWATRQAEFLEELSQSTK